MFLRLLALLFSAFHSVKLFLCAMLQNGDFRYWVPDSNFCIKSVAQWMRNGRCS
jgi:hypothetical protein